MASFLKQEREYQHAPGIEKILEDVIGGGTVDRSDMAGALFAGKPLDELPPFAPVVTALRPGCRGAPCGRPQGA